MKVLDVAGSSTLISAVVVCKRSVLCPFLRVWNRFSETDHLHELHVMISFARTWGER